MPEIRALAAISSEAPTLVTFRGGFAADWTLVAKLLAIEARGCTFELLPDGRICVRPSGQLSLDEIDFLRLHRSEARRVLLYQAADSHLKN